MSTKQLAIGVGMMRSEHWTQVLRIDHTAYANEPLTIEDLELSKRNNEPMFIAYAGAGDCEDDVLAYVIAAESHVRAEWWLMRVAVHPKHYRRGIGTALVSRVVEFLTDDIHRRRVLAFARAGCLQSCTFLESLAFEQTRAPVGNGLIEFAIERPADDYSNSEIKELAAEARKRRGKNY